MSLANKHLPAKQQDNQTREREKMQHMGTELEEPTYNRFQIVVGSIAGVAAVAVAVGGILSLLSAL